MPAYWIAHVTITDPVGYQDYQALAPAIFYAYGAKFIVRGGESETTEGPEYARHVIIEFPTLEAARACYASPEYQAAKACRDVASTAMVVIVDGLPR